MSVLLVALAGCAVGPDYQTPEIAAAHAREGSQGAARPAKLTHWWRQLHDPILDALIEEAVDRNLDVATAKAKIREARASRRKSIGGLWPTITGSGSATRNGSGATAVQTSGSSVELGMAYNMFQAGFDASWELDLFGANRREVEAATYGVEAADEQLRATLLTLIGDVASYYVEARGYQARIALARRTAASQRATAGLTRIKFEAGSASAVDVAKAAALAASTEADVATHQASYAEAVHRLGVLLGREPGALAERLQSGGVIPAPGKTLPSRVPAALLLDRPDVKAAERQLAQATAKIGAAEAALYPSVSLTGSVATSGLKLQDLAKATSISWSYGPTVSVPIFDGGALRAAVDVAAAQRDQYFVALKSAVLSALEDIDNASVSFTKEQARTQSLAEATRNYRNAAQLSRTLYQSGSASFLDLLDAERSLYSAEDALLQSRIAVATDYVAWAKALGGGWDAPVNADRPEVLDKNTGPHLAKPP